MDARPTWLLVLLLLEACGGAAPPSAGPRALAPAIDAPASRPRATLDLATDEGASLVGASWRYVDVRIDEVTSPTPGPDLRPTGPPAPTHDVFPRPGRAGWDEAPWASIAPGELVARRGGGHLSFGWFRTTLTLPARLGDADVTGATVALEIVADDYGEVWVDGRLPRRVGLRGASVVAGFNAPNRVVLTDHARPGDRFELAVFVMNGPVSVSTDNFLWIRSAVLELHAPRGRVGDPGAHVLCETAAFCEAVVDRDAVVERVASGFARAAGIAWAPGEGSLLVSDLAANTVFRYEPAFALHVFRSHAGYVGTDVATLALPGVDGIAIDADERVSFVERGRRRVTRTERTGALVTVLDAVDARGVVASGDGALFVATAQGVLNLAADGAHALPSPLRSPAGVAATEDWLVATDGAPDHPVVVRWPLASGGPAGEAALFATLGAGPLDGAAFAPGGWLFVATARGVEVLGEDGSAAGRVELPEPAHGVAIAPDAIYVSTDTSLFRIPRASR